MAPELRKRLTREDLIRIIEESERAKQDTSDLDDDRLLDSDPPKKRKTRRKKPKAKKVKKPLPPEGELEEGEDEFPVGNETSPFVSASMRPKIRDQIIEMHKAGVRHTAIARRLKTTTSTVSRWIKRFEETGNTRANYRRNRPKSHQAEQADFIVDYICGIPVNEDELQRIFVSYTTIQRRIKVRYNEFCSGKVNFIKEYKEALENFMYNKDGKKPEMLRKILKGAYNCSVCDRPFKNNCQKLKHELCHTDLKPYPCRYCDKSFRAPHNVLVHERLHTGEKPYLCRFCEKRFIDIGNCYKHIANRHKELHEEAKKQNIRSVIRIKDESNTEKIMKKVKNENENKLQPITKFEPLDYVQEKPGARFPKTDRAAPMIDHQMQQNKYIKTDKSPPNLVDELFKELISPITTIQSVNAASSNIHYNIAPSPPSHQPPSTLPPPPTHHYVPYPAHMQPANLTPQPTQSYSHPIYHQPTTPNVSHSVFGSNVVQYR